MPHPILATLGYFAWLLLYIAAATGEFSERKSYFPTVIWVVFFCWDTWLAISLLISQQPAAYRQIAPFLVTWPVISLSVLGMLLKRKSFQVTPASVVSIAASSLAIFTASSLAFELRDAVVATGYGVLIVLLSLEFLRIDQWRDDISLPFSAFHATRAITPTIIMFGLGIPTLARWSNWIFFTYALLEIILSGTIIRTIVRGRKARQSPDDTLC